MPSAAGGARLQVDISQPPSELAREDAQSARGLVYERQHKVQLAEAVQGRAAAAAPAVAPAKMYSTCRLCAGLTFERLRSMPRRSHARHSN